jgi:hypothetical protein
LRNALASICRILQNIGPDYERTLLAWWENFDRAYPELKAKYDQRFYRMWKFYLLAAAGASRARDGQLFHLVLTKFGRKLATFAFRQEPMWSRCPPIVVVEAAENGPHDNRAGSRR